MNSMNDIFIFFFSYGLCTECLWFFSAILAKCSGLVPYFLMCSLPALPNICAAMGLASIPSVFIITSTCLSRGLVRSSNWKMCSS